jgi:hypothetical protein
MRALENPSAPQKAFDYVGILFVCAGLAILAAILWFLLTSPYAVPLIVLGVLLVLPGLGLLFLLRKAGNPKDSLIPLIASKAGMTCEKPPYMRAARGQAKYVCYVLPEVDVRKSGQLDPSHYVFGAGMDFGFHKFSISTRTYAERSLMYASDKPARTGTVFVECPDESLKAKLEEFGRSIPDDMSISIYSDAMGKSFTAELYPPPELPTVFEIDQGEYMKDPAKREEYAAQAAKFILGGMDVLERLVRVLEAPRA